MKGRISVARKDQIHIITLEGDVRLTFAEALNHYIARVLEQLHKNSDGRVVIDVSRAESIDSTILGLLARLAVKCPPLCQERKATVYSPNHGITRLLNTLGLERIMLIIDTVWTGDAQEVNCCESSTDEQRLKRHVLEAHKTLCEINKNNKTRFHDLLEMLQSD